MARPEVSDLAEELYEALSVGPFTAEDEDHDWPLLRFCDALCAGTLTRIHEVVSDRDEYPGWTVVFDPDACPDWALPYLAQFVGVELEPALTEEQRRDKIRLPEGYNRGTRAALEQAVQRTLSDPDGHVAIDERYEGSAYRLAVRTQIDETPDEAATRVAILSQKPIGIVLDYDSVTGRTLDEVRDAYATLDDVAADNATLSDVLLLD